MYKPLIVNNREVFRPRYHPETLRELLRQNKEREAREKHAALRREFARQCPPLFLETKEELLPPEYKLIQKWLPDESGRGLLLLGPTGSGKTRCIWQIVRRLYLGEQIRSFVFLTEIKLASMAIEAACNGNGGWQRMLRNLASTALLAIDDIGKAKHTERSREALFELIDQRVAHKRPVLYTTQFSADELKLRLIGSAADEMSDVLSETAAALLRRIKESSQIIVIKEKKSK